MFRSSAQQREEAFLTKSIEKDEIIKWTESYFFPT